MYLLSIFIISIVAGLCHSMPLTANEIFTVCTDNCTGTVLKVTLDNCDSTPCYLDKNTTVNITVWFKSQFDVNSLKLDVYGKKSYIKLPFIEGADVCGGKYNMECPIKANETQIFKMQVGILSYYPSWKLTVVAVLYDANSNKYVVCIKIQVKIR